MSSVPTGTYERADDKITMKRQGADAVYVFELEGENLVFDRRNLLISVWKTMRFLSLDTKR